MRILVATCAAILVRATRRAQIPLAPSGRWTAYVPGGCHPWDGTPGTPSPAQSTNKGNGLGPAYHPGGSRAQGLSVHQSG